MNKKAKSKWFIKAEKDHGLTEGYKGGLEAYRVMALHVIYRVMPCLLILKIDKFKGLTFGARITT